MRSRSIAPTPSHPAAGRRGMNPINLMLVCILLLAGCLIWALVRLRQQSLLVKRLIQLNERQKLLEYTAHYDPLTRLPNRLLLAERMQQSLRRLQRRGTSLAVAFIDLDGFKAVNDQYGHMQGDELLQAAALHMQETLRDSDTLARLGGDEFIAIIDDLQHPQDHCPVLERLLRAVAEPVRMADGSLVQLSASIGVALAPLHGDHTELLISKADAAMYEAKRAGKNRYVVNDDYPALEDPPMDPPGYGQVAGTTMTTDR